MLHVIPSVAPRYGGPSQAVYQMCTALQRRSIEMLIATTDADGAGEMAVSLATVIDYQGVPTIFFHRQWSEALKYSHKLASWLEQNVSSFALVHIHAVFSHACLAAARACQRQQVPYIVRPLGTLDPWSLQQKRWRKRLFWQLSVKHMLQRAAAVHYTTVEEQRLVEATLGLRRGVAIPLGVDERLFEPCSNQSALLNGHPQLQPAPYVLMLCRLHQKKGLELFFEAFLSVTSQPEFRHWKLVVAGDGEAGYVSELKRLAQQLGGEGRVHFTGWLAGEEKRAALQQAALFALPSRQENFGISVIEALACGVPVLISEHVNLATEVATAQAGWVVPLGRAVMSRALEEALRDAEQRKTKGAAGRLLVEQKFRWTAVAEQLKGLYEKVRDESATS